MTDIDNDHTSKGVAMEVTSVSRAGFLNGLEGPAVGAEGALSQLEGRRSVLGPNSTAHQPETVPALLRTLQVRQASVTQELDALRGWLRHNAPNSLLRLSFHRNGYGSLLYERFGRSNTWMTRECWP